MKPKSDKIEVVFNHELISKEPILTVQILTYNHEKYIRDCLEGIVMQQTNFEFVVYIREDFSTDKTRKVLLEFQKNYPHLFKLYLCNENLYSQGKSSGMSKDINSKYVALCEGDDYWIDPFKIQKQVDFLEKNKKYIAHFFNAEKLYEDGKKIKYHSDLSTGKVPESKIFLMGGGIYPTASFMYRNVTINTPEFMQKTKSGDRVLSLLLLEKGDFYFHSDVSSVYRIHSGGIYSSTRNEKGKMSEFNIQNINLLVNYNVYTNRKFSQEITKALSKEAREVIINSRWFDKSVWSLYKFIKPKDALRIIKYKIF
ncbi:MAG: glycosyltransferase [Cyclobacteriaceae bacterium]|nr:glycosyltransferase [Cyclobacteriaceae bacterium]MCH8515288.1 glycosyltransferase [Cyclobacteriaceae bacterium]